MGLSCPGWDISDGVLTGTGTGSRLPVCGDYACGLYLDAFPLQQMVMMLFPVAGYGQVLAGGFAVLWFCRVVVAWG
jgi:hypothetical protein